MRDSSSQSGWQESVAKAAAAHAARLKKLGPWRKQLSPGERKFLATTLDTMTEQQHRDATWRLEAFQVLAWALGPAPELPRWDTQTNRTVMDSYPPPGFGRDLAKARLIERDSIIHAREIAELWHWRSRTRLLIESGAKWPAALSRPEEGLVSYDAVARMAARAARERGDVASIIEDDLAAFGKAYRDLDAGQYAIVTSIARERHFALNWLCGYAPGNRWDETPTET